jgi:zinc finger protein DZIP1
MNTDIERITTEVDLRQLESLLQNITYSLLDREDLERMGDAHFVKLFRLSQLSIEYLIYTQNYLETLTKSLDFHYKQAYEDTAKIRDKIKLYSQENLTLKKELKIKQKTLSTYEYLLKLPSQQETDFYKCNLCSKFFVSYQYIEKHYSRNHPDVNFATDYKGPKS